MLGKTHLITALATSIAIADAVQEPKEKLLFILGSCLTAKLPDIDQSIGLKHRGITHSVWGLMIVTLAFIPLGVTPLTIGLIWGYMVHILADSFTRGGIYPLYPYRIHVRLGSITTGNKAHEQGFLFMVWLLVGGYYYIKVKGLML